VFVGFNIYFETNKEVHGHVNRPWVCFIQLHNL